MRVHGRKVHQIFLSGLLQDREIEAVNDFQIVAAQLPRRRHQVAKIMRIEFRRAAGNVERGNGGRVYE